MSVTWSARRWSGSAPRPTPFWPRSTTAGRRVVARTEHEQYVNSHDVFGVPTFIIGDDAVFARLMTRPEGNGALARETIDRVLALLVDHPELNEFKHTRIAR